MPKPSIGRVVHYVSYGTPGGEYGSRCRAAIVTEVSGNSDFVGLAVLNPTGMFFNQNVEYQDGQPDSSVQEMCDGRFHNGGTWHWPARTFSETLKDH